MTIAHDSVLEREAGGVKREANLQFAWHLTDFLKTKSDAAFSCSFSNI